MSDVTLMQTGIIDVSATTASFAAKFIEPLINPAITPDQIIQMTEDNVLLNNPELLTFKDLDMTPVNMDRVAFDYLRRFRRGGHFIFVKGYHKDIPL